MSGIGLRQGCSASPMIFRWVLQDGLMPLHNRRVDARRGILAEEETLTHLAWADDTWLFSDNPASAEIMLSELESVGARETALLFRWDKCTVMEVPREAPQPEPEADSKPHTKVLHKMARADRGHCVRLMGATTQLGAQYRGERLATRQTCWAVFYLRRRFWRLRWFGVAKMRACYKWPSFRS